MLMMLMKGVLDAVKLQGTPFDPVMAPAFTKRKTFGPLAPLAGTWGVGSEGFKLMDAPEQLPSIPKLVPQQNTIMNKHIITSRFTWWNFIVYSLIMLLEW
jgi:hypothetical protein